MKEKWLNHFKKEGNLAKMLLKESKKSKDSLKNAKMIAMLIENIQLLEIKIND